MLTFTYEYKLIPNQQQIEVTEVSKCRSALGHSVLENACGDGLTGALPSQESVKQEIFSVS